MIGKTLSHYKIIEKIGQGGMGVVYRAEDTNLSRDVAIKVLPEQFTQDPQRLARFEREAKLLASLNHPNIAAIYGLEEADGVRFLALELVEGETLAERVAKGPVPVEEALEVCRQIAEGVEAAHEKGVIHRDLKPANVKVTPEGKVKILDFGLAKAFEGETPVADISQSPTLTEEMTKAGVILGTAAYMSPEQARGKAVDKRSDVFAFGCVLFELLTGKRAFGGETVTDTLAKILEGEPDWNVLSPTVPSTIRFLMGRCLQKDPGKRLQHIDGARILIEEALTGTTTASTIGLAGAPQPARWRRAMTLGLVALLGGVISVALWSLISSSPPAPRLNKFAITPSPDAPLAEIGFSVVAISSDGRRVVYVADSQGTRQLYVRSLDDFLATPIPGTEGMAGEPLFSPDGESIVFHATGQLKRVSIMGGSPITLCDVEVWTGGSWFEDTILFGAGAGGLYRVSAAGGEPEILATVDPNKGETSYATPDILPGGKAVLFTIYRGSDSPQIAVLSLETGGKKILKEQGVTARYSPTGHIVYVIGTGSLMAVPFDLASLEVSGDPVSVLEGIRRYGGTADYTLSPNGALVYVPDQEYRYSPVWVDRKGTETLVTQEKREYALPRISADGKRVIFTLRTTGSPSNVVIYDLEQDAFSLLTFEGGLVAAGMWTPDGNWITFSANVGGQTNIYRQLSDRSALPEQLTTYTDPSPKAPSSWSPDERVLIFHNVTVPSPSAGWDILILNTAENGEPQPFMTSPNHECCAKFSPDGKWLAYVSNELGRNHVYVRPYPGPDIKFLVSEEAQGGGEPVWSPDGAELFYRNGNRMMAVPVQSEPTFRAGKPEVLFEGLYRTTPIPAGLQYYDISPDGQRFLMIRRDQAPAQINVVLNWFEELKRLVPTN